MSKWALLCEPIAARTPLYGCCQQLDHAPRCPPQRQRGLGCQERLLACL